MADMQSIFKDECVRAGPILPELCGTGRIFPMRSCFYLTGHAIRISAKVSCWAQNSPPSAARAN